MNSYIAEQLKPTLHIVAKGGGWYRNFTYTNQLGQAKESLTSLENITLPALEDGLLNKAEKEAVRQSLNVVTADKSEIDAQYTAVYGNSSLIGTPKTNLYNAKVAYNTAYGILEGAINTVLNVADGTRVTTAQYNNVQTRFTNYQNSLSTLRQRFEEALDAISGKKVKDVNDELVKVATRVSTAEQKITDSAITSTVTSSTTFKDIQNKANSAKSTLDSKSSVWDSKATPDDISTAIDNVEIGGRNLVLDSNKPKSHSNYMVGEYFISEDFIEGETYAVTLKGTKLESQDFGLWQNAGSSRRGIFSSRGNDTWELTFTSTAISPGHERIIRIYQPEGATAGPVTIDWIKLEKGNKATDWTPAPEDVEDSINNVASDLSAVESRVRTAEQKITDDKIVSTVTSSTTFKTVAGNASSAKTTLDSKAGVWDGKASTGYVDGKASTAEANAKTHAENLDAVQALAGNSKKFINPASLRGASSATGYLIIRTPITSSFMTRLKISGYNYVNNNTDISLDVGFYAYTAGSIVQTSYVSHGDFSINKVQMARDSSGRAVVIIGEANTQYKYPNIVVDEAIIGHNTPPDSYKDGWSMSISTSLSGLSNIVNVAGSDTQKAIGDVVTRVSTAEQKITDNAIVSTVTQSSTYTNAMGKLVEKDKIASTINQTAQDVTINANKINLQGAVTISSFNPSLKSDYDSVKSTASTAKSKTDAWSYQNTTEIDGGTIRTGTIEVGTIKGRLPGNKLSLDGNVEITSTLKVPVANITGLTANNITAGTLKDANNRNNINLNNGTFSLANGNIIYDGSALSIKGGVTFNALDSTTRTNITNGAAAKSTLDSKASTWDAKETTSGAQAKANAAEEIATIFARTSAGKLVSTDPLFQRSSNGFTVYNNSSNSNVTVTREHVPTGNQPGGNPYRMRIRSTGAASPGWGGFIRAQNSRANAEFVIRFTANIPSGRTVSEAKNAIGNGAQTKWLTSRAGTGTWQEYAYYYKCGTGGTFSNFGHVSISGGSTPTASAPLTWYVSKYEMIDISDSANPASLDDLRSSGSVVIHGGNITANTLSADKITGRIPGGKITLDGDVTVNGTFKVNNTNINSGIEANKITTGTMHGNRITANTISANRINATTLSAISADLGEVRAGTIRPTLNTSNHYTEIDLNKGVYESYGTHIIRYQYIATDGTSGWTEESHPSLLKIDGGTISMESDSSNNKVTVGAAGVSLFQDSSSVTSSASLNMDGGLFPRLNLSHTLMSGGDMILTTSSLGFYDRGESVPVTRISKIESSFKGNVVIGGTSTAKPALEIDGSNNTRHPALQILGNAGDHLLRTRGIDGSNSNGSLGDLYLNNNSDGRVFIGSDHSEIISSGSNSDGLWMKFYNGMMMCWHEVNMTYRQAQYLQSDWSFPNKFTGTPIVLATKAATWTANRTNWASISTNRHLSTVTVRLWHSHNENFQSGDSFKAVVLAIGRWK